MNCINIHHIFFAFCVSFYFYSLLWAREKIIDELCSEEIKFFGSERLTPEEHNFVKSIEKKFNIIHKNIFYRKCPFLDEAFGIPGMMLSCFVFFDEHRERIHIIGIDKKFMETKPDNEKMFVLGHELGHVYIDEKILSKKIDITNYYKMKKQYWKQQRINWTLPSITGICTFYIMQKLQIRYNNSILEQCGLITALVSLLPLIFALSLEGFFEKKYLYYCHKKELFCDRISAIQLGSDCSMGGIHFFKGDIVNEKISLLKIVSTIISRCYYNKKYKYRISTHPTKQTRILQLMKIYANQTTQKTTFFKNIKNSLIYVKKYILTYVILLFDSMITE